MPELPEVEVTRLSLAPLVEGAQVTAVRVGKPLRFALGAEPTKLVGAHVGPLRRRGKYIWMPLSTMNEPDAGLLWHLGMSGSLSFQTQPPAPGAHDHFDLCTHAGVVRLHDPRRFGAVIWGQAWEADLIQARVGHLGAEPLAPGFDGGVLHRGWRGRTSSVKQALLAGDVVVGVGNIYACEALFDARIHPLAPCGSLSRVDCNRLAQAIVANLTRALAMGGTTLRNFRNVHGMAGAFQFQAKVYGREGQPCVRCAGRRQRSVERLVQGQRATYFCAGCQTRPLGQIY